MTIGQDYVEEDEGIDEEVLEEYEEEVDDYLGFYGDELTDFTTKELSTPFVKKIKLDLNVNNANFNAVFIGKSGSGKSWASLRLAEKVDDDFNVNKVVFNVKDFMKLLVKKKIKKGDVIIFDEAGVGVNARLWYSTINRVANATFQTMRNRNFATLFTVPFTEYVDTQTRKMFHAIFEALKILRSRGLSIFKVKKIHYSIHKAKYLFPKYEFKINGSYYTLERIMFRKPSRKLINAYEKKKQEFQDQLYQASLEELEKQEGKTIGKDEERKKKIQEAIEKVKGAIDNYVKKKGDRYYIDINLLKADFGFSSSIAKAVKVLIEKELGW